MRRALPLWLSLSVALACTGTRPATNPPTSSPTARVELPLVFAVHHTRPPIDVTRATADDLAAGRVTDWAALGEPPAPIRIATGDAAVRAVGRDRDAIAVVPATALDGSVHVVSVDGVDPLRRPGDYPIRVEGDAPSTVTTMIVAGDVMMDRRVGERMADLDDFAWPFRLVAGRLSDANIAVVNLESALARLGPPTQGDAFAADRRALEGLRLAGVDLVTLANNHTGDFGRRSLIRTVDTVEAAGIPAIGAGRDLARALEPEVIEHGGVRFGFLGFNAIGETPAATATRAGAASIRMQPRTGPLNGGDLRAFADEVRALRTRVDVVVVLPHWGAQYTRAVHPDQRAVAAELARAGAGLIVGTHSHWAGGLDEVQGALVAYSLGNFVFDMDLSAETLRGIALELVFWDGRLRGVEPVPVQIARDFRPRFLDAGDGREILDDVYASSRGPFRAR